MGWGRPESRRFENVPACVWKGQRMPFATNPTLFLLSVSPSGEGERASKILKLPQRECRVLVLNTFDLIPPLE